MKFFILKRRLDLVLVDKFPNYSRSKLKSWIKSGLVTVNGKVVNLPSKKIFDNDLIKVEEDKNKFLFYKSQDIPLNIVYEDEDIIIINKHKNIAVHPGAGNIDNTIINALIKHFPPIINIPRMGIIHRLDKDTTGLMIVSKSTIANSKLTKAIYNREIIREYEAIVNNRMISGGSVKKPISRSHSDRTKMIVHNQGKEATTHYRIIERFRNHTHIRLYLETGRTHQIRVHMLSINYPIVGDHKYGKRCKFLKKSSKKLNELLQNFNRQALHATMLQFCHPITSIQITCHSSLPHDMYCLIQALKEDVKLNKSII